jgi:hypothetical protein
MNAKSDILLNWEIEAIEFYVEKASTFFIKEIDNADDEIRLPSWSKKSLANAAFRYFRQSVLYELNALVEHYLQIAAADESGLLASNENLKRSRSESIKVILEKYNINIRNLTGYDEVKQLYSIVNALKHRGGFEYTDFSKVIPETRLAKTEIRKLKELKAGVYIFVRELINSILLIENK